MARNVVAVKCVSEETLPQNFVSSWTKMTISGQFLGQMWGAPTKANTIQYNSSKKQLLFHLFSSGLGEPLEK